MKLKDAEVSWSEEVTDAVITVPACFNDSQRKATKAGTVLVDLKPSVIYQ